MDKLQVGELTISVAPSAAQEALRLDWHGRSNDRHPGYALGPFLATTLASAAASGRAIELHFEALSYLNSSTIAAVVQLLNDARKRAVKVVIVYDDALRWQRVSIAPLRGLETSDHLLQIRSA